MLHDLVKSSPIYNDSFGYILDNDKEDMLLRDDIAYIAKEIKKVLSRCIEEPVDIKLKDLDIYQLDPDDIEGDKIHISGKNLALQSIDWSSILSNCENETTKQNIIKIIDALQND